MPTKVTNSHLFTGFCISVNRAGLQQVTCHTCITSYLPVQHLWCQRAGSSIVDLTASNIALKAGKNAAKTANLSGPSVKDVYIKTYIYIRHIPNKINVVTEKNIQNFGNLWSL